MYHHDLIRALVAEVRSLRQEVDNLRQEVDSLNYSLDAQAEREERAAARRSQERRWAEQALEDERRTQQYHADERARALRDLERAQLWGQDYNAQRALERLKRYS